MIRLLGFLMTAVVVLGADPVASSRESPRPPEIPFEVVRNRVTVPVWVEGSDTLRIILDTGMPIDGIYIFHKDFADRIGNPAPVEARVGGAGAGEASSALLFDSTSVFVGGVEFRNRMVVVSMSPTTQDLPRGGVIGKTLFGEHAVEVDYEDSVLRLHPPSFAPDSTWTPVDLTEWGNVPFLEAFLSVNGEEPVRVLVYIDLASAEALELLVQPKMKFTLPEDLSDERYIGTGLSGDIQGRLGRVDRFRIGDAEFRDVGAEFVEGRVRSKQKGADGIVGHEILRRFNVVFNMPGKAIYLKPNRAFGDPFPEGMD